MGDIDLNMLQHTATTTHLHRNRSLKLSQRMNLNHCLLIDAVVLPVTHLLLCLALPGDAVRHHLMQPSLLPGDAVRHHPMQPSLLPGDAVRHPLMQPSLLPGDAVRHPLMQLSPACLLEDAVRHPLLSPPLLLPGGAVPAVILMTLKCVRATRFRANSALFNFII